VHSATSAAGETCDLLCSFPSGGGRVLVSPAAALLRNDAMGKEHDPPTEQTLPFHQLQTVLIDELLRHANSSRAQR
jgi:hypothetical protein